MKDAVNKQKLITGTKIVIHTYVVVFARQGQLTSARNNGAHDITVMVFLQLGGSAMR